MLRNYLKTSLRHILQNRLFAGLNITGLALGLAAAILIFLWVRDERSYDRFNPDADSIFRLTAVVKGTAVAATPSAFGRISDAIPEIRRMTRVQQDKLVMSVNHRKFDEKQVLRADTNFLLLFHYPLLRGDPRTVLAAPNNIVLTATTAIKYFGSIDLALGNAVFDENDSVMLKATGVLADIPGNSHLRFDMVLPIRNMDAVEDPSHGWRFFDSYVYYKLAGPVRPSPSVVGRIERRLNDMRAAAIAGTPAVPARFSLQPLPDIHLKSNFTIDVSGTGNIRYVRIFTLVAVFILVIACINFTNLATAVAGARTKEVGLRKTLGARRYQLVGQSIGESMLLAIVSLALALLFVYLALPAFNSLAAKSITLHLSNLRLTGGVLAITLSAGLMAGCYPAFYLSAVNTIAALKGNTALPGGGPFFRNLLVVFQFTVTVILIVCTVIVGRQLRYLHDRDIGFDRNNLLYVALPEIGNRKNEAGAMRSLLSQSAVTQDFTIVGDLPTDLAGARPFSWPGMDPHSLALCHYMNVDAGTLRTFGMKMAAGRFYPPGFSGNDSVFDYVINETAARTMGKTPETAVGSRIFVRSAEGTVIGVVRDFNFRPVHQPVEPLVMRAYPAGYFAVVRATAGHMHETLAAVRDSYERVFRDTPFSFGFVDQDLDRLYLAESRMGSLFEVFSVLFIFISCLGLFGLANFTARRRAREMSIRKVLGAVGSNIILLLGKEFLRLVGMALVIAVPLGCYLMRVWLQGFAYRVDLGWQVFVWPSGLLFLTALLTIGYTTLRAACSNPVAALRSE